MTGATATGAATGRLTGVAVQAETGSVGRTRTVARAAGPRTQKRSGHPRAQAGSLRRRTLRRDWRERRDEILGAAAEAVRLYQDLGATFGPLLTATRRTGDNRASERGEVVAAFEEDRQAGTANARAVQVQFRSDRPQAEVVQAVGFTFGILARNARKLAAIVVTGLLGEVGKDLAPGTTEMIEKLAHMLDHFGRTLLALLPH